MRLHAQAVPTPRSIPIDPWENPYVYRTDPGVEGGYTLHSFGKNGQDDALGGDDVVNRAQVDVKIYPELYGGALQIFPLAVMVVLAPILWAVLRAAKRASQ